MNQNSIILVFLIAFLFTNCKNETIKKADTIFEKQSPKVMDENFVTFLNNFSRDSIFQISRIKFPLKIKEIDNENMIQLIEKTIPKSEYSKLDFTYSKDALTRELDRYSQKIVFKNNIAVVEIRGVDNGIYSDFSFEKIDGKWFLKTWKDQSN
ncbi:DUF4348 domain-containing protein [Flavobacterium piscis]|uniref:DUF4348 domain-containing protein n=1 Tax=Flavobacterium piscis TaxID=1114874 RepID=A0ABU1Y7B7_9FLAO|nr:DUF4348 domain-containing protein [Flavobacterium piscis]MDR7210043.1 hypothetical protein [Flavobacterium piscis]